MRAFKALALAAGVALAAQTKGDDVRRPAFDGSTVMVSRTANAYHPTKESARQTGGAYAARVLCRLGERPAR